ncbi:MAG TPA: T9SS type A sorting domain-containing protein, partial [Bacteroidales bacterium]|nr:T9SS type A sorting domain-containing protein [Bacteroidales bacterium]
TAQFDTITLNGSTYGSAFIASYDTYGNLRWAKPITSTNYIRIKDLEINKNNTLYITGYFSGNANIDNNIISSTGEDFYFAVLDTSANANLVVKNDSHNSAAGLSIMTDNESNIYLGGHFYDTLTISVDTIFNNSIRAKSFLAKYDSIGNYLWSKKIGGDNFGEASISDIKIDANNRIFISGNFSNKLYFMSDSIDGNPSDFFLAKTTNNGQLIWLRGGGGTSSDQCYAIDIDSKSNIYLAGSITDTIHCGAITLNADGTEVFIAKCDSSGNFIWADHSSTTIISRAYGISTDFDDYVYLTGFYRETIELGPFSLTTGLPDIFIAKINSHTMIEEVSNKDNNLLVYPNPSNNIITLNVNKNDIDLSNSVAYIYNNYGQLETMCEITKTTNVIDVSDLSNGIHFLVIRDDSTTISNKFIKN